MKPQRVRPNLRSQAITAATIDITNFVFITMQLHTRTRVVLCLWIVALCLSTSVFSQQDSTSTDSTDAPNGISVGPGGVSFSAGLGLSVRRPGLQVSYGVADFQYKTSFNPSIQPMRMIDIGLQSLVTVPLRRKSDIGRTSADRLYLQLYGANYGGTVDNMQSQLKGLRWGFDLVSGYSYLDSQGSPTISLLHRGGPVWSYNTFTINSLAVPPNDPQAQLAAELAKSHFGSHTGAIIRWDLNSTFAINAEWERTMMFDDYSFFGWLGSVTLEGLSQAILGGTGIHRIETKASRSVPVANLLLRSALSFGIYELRRSKQHFPFGSTAPMVSDAFRFGLTVSF